MRVSGCKEYAFKEVACELQELWIFLNLQPKCHSQIVLMLKKLIEKVLKIRDYPLKKQAGAAFQKSLGELLDGLENGFDIRTTDKKRMEELENKYFVEMTEDSEEFKLYVDNCVPLEEDKPPAKKGRCPRLMWSTTEVDGDWVTTANERLAKLEEEKKSAARKAEKVEKKRLEEKEREENAAAFMKSAQSVPDDEPNEDADFVAPIYSRRNKSAPEEQQDWPQIKTRDGYRKMNVKVMEVLMVLVSTYKVSENKAAACLQMVLNTLCSQNLLLPSPKVAELEDDLDPSSTRTWTVGDLSYTLPSPQTIHKWVEDGAILSLWHVADEMKVASEKSNTATTLGTDDTVKAQGFKRADVKTGHVTIVEQQGNKKVRSNYSLGYYPNISHSGSDSAITVNTVLDMLAVVSDSKPEEVKDFIDWFQGDRAGDNLVMLEELGVKEEKTVKCNAHILLAIEDAMDSVMCDTEVAVGKDKLISTEAAHVFTSSGSSIPTLAQIAIAKQFSPSHCQESVSQFSAYKIFLQERAGEGDTHAKELLKKGFVGFSSNRFGRRSALATMILEHLPVLKEFMTQNVDEFQNKLSLANSIYLHNDWVILCCRVMAKFDELLVTPLLSALGVDHFKKERSENRSWKGLKEFFGEKMLMLDRMTSVTEKSSGFELLLSKCATKIKQSVQRQLDYVQFYKSSDEMSEEAKQKLELCPLTNSNCEGEFAHLDNDIKRVGGTVSIQTLSNRHLVDSNKLFSSDKWKILTPAEQRLNFHWSRSSKQAKKVREIGKEYLEKVQVAERLSLKAKAEAKQKKLRRSMKLLDVVKSHGGPVSEEDLDKIDTMTDKQLLAEIAYLRVTIAPNIKQKRKLASGKFQTFKHDELKSQIRNVVKPEKFNSTDVDTLVIDVLSKQVPEITAPVSPIMESGGDAENNDAVLTDGAVAVFKNEGSLGEEFLGAVLSESKVQPYKCSEKGFIPDDVPVQLSDLKFVKHINPSEFSYVMQGAVMYLKLV